MRGNGMPAKWGEITAHDLMLPMDGRQISGPPNVSLRGLSTDSRTIGPGEIFLALKGERYDGHDFLTDAVNAGAAGVIVERGAAIPEQLATNGLIVITVASTLEALGNLARWWRKRWARKVIAITGSNGKSTTKEMAASILAQEAITKKSPGSFNNLVGLPLTILSLEEEHELAVLEMGMNRPGEIARLTQIADPDIGLITNVATAHLEWLGDIYGVIEAKGELLTEMSDNSPAILNGDGEFFSELASKARGPIITFGLGKTNQIRAQNIKKLPDNGQAFDICLDSERVLVFLQPPGTHNVYNALAAAAVASCLSLSKELIARGLKEFIPLGGRFQVTDLNGGVRIIDDTYNSNPSSLSVAFQTVKELRGEEQGLVVALGEMLELGSETSRYHLHAGKLVAAAGARYLVAMGEHGAQIIEGARRAGMNRAQTYLATSHGEMIDALTANVREHDMLFLKGSRKVALDKVVEAMKGFFRKGRGRAHAL